MPPLITEGDAVFALAFPGVKRPAAVRKRGDSAQSQWLQLNLRPERLPDAGGNPVHDAGGNLVGMLTRNADHGSGYLYALSMERIRSLVEQYEQERRLLPDARTCVGCGSLTRAILFGGSYCEICGAMLSVNAERLAPDPERLRQLYDGPAAHSCPHCAAAAGSYAGRCLRCGRDWLRIQYCNSKGAKRCRIL